MMRIETTGVDLAAHMKATLARARDLRPIEPQIRQILTAGKREQLLAGKDADGKDFAKLKKSTLKRRNGNGPPLIPGRTSSRVIVNYEIVFERREFSVGVLAGWRGLPWVKYHREGTRHMAKRDPGGFREKDRRAVGELVRNYIVNGRA